MGTEGTHLYGDRAPHNLQYVVLVASSNLTQERVLTGTANQITVTDNGAGSTVVLSTPQNLHTSATPTFGGIIIADGGTIGQAAGPLLTFDDTNNFLEIAGCKVGMGTTTPVTQATIEGALTLKEQAAADGDTAAYGQVWVKNETPNELWFTDDAGTDAQCATSGGSMVKIDETDLASDTATISFSSIPATYFNLHILGTMRSATADVTDSVYMRYNDDDGANYHWTIMYFNEADSFLVGENLTDTEIFVGSAVGNTGSANRWSPLMIDVSGYAKDDRHKSCLLHIARSYNDVTGVSQAAYYGHGTWRNTAAINKITFLLSSGDDFLAGSHIVLYGMT